MVKRDDVRRIGIPSHPPTRRTQYCGLECQKTLDKACRDLVYLAREVGRVFWFGTQKKEVIMATTLRKSDLSARVAAKMGSSRAQGEAALKAVLDSVQEALAAGDRVVLTGFGSFEVRGVKARRVRPIRGGSAGNLITVPAHKRVGFTAGAELSKSAQG